MRFNFPVSITLVILLSLVAVPVRAGEPIDFRWSKTLGRIHHRSSILRLFRTHTGDVRAILACGTICTAGIVIGAFSVALAGPTFGVIPLVVVGSVGISIPTALLVAKADTRPIMVRTSTEVRQDIEILEHQKADHRLTPKQLEKYMVDATTRFGIEFCRGQNPPMKYISSILLKKYKKAKAVPTSVAIEALSHEGHAERTRSKIVYLPEPIDASVEYRKELFHNKSNYPHILVANITCESIPAELSLTPDSPGILSP